MASEKRYGTTCCRSEPHPSRSVLSCHGPQIGKPCRKKSECDIICECPDPNLEAGTSGVVGTCGGRLFAGIWMCEIDEAGRVTSLIID